MDARLFLMLYLAPFRDLRIKDHKTWLEESRPLETQSHKCGDGLALLNLRDAYEAAGYRFARGGLILNCPRDVRNLLQEDSRLAERTWVPLGPKDGVLAATRLPMDDHGAFEQDDLDEEADDLRADRRRTARSGHAIEREVFTGLRYFFQTCTRPLTVIDERIALHGDAADFREVHFYSNGGGRILSLRDASGRLSKVKDDPTLTLGYLVALPRVAPGNYRFVGAWGSGGTETLALSQLLAGPFQDTLQSAVAAEVPSLWLIPFRSPSCVPIPLLQFREEELMPSPPRKWGPLGPFT